MRSSISWVQSWDSLEHWLWVIVYSSPGGTSRSIRSRGKILRIQGTSLPAGGRDSEGRQELSRCRLSCAQRMIQSPSTQVLLRRGQPPQKMAKRQQQNILHYLHPQPPLWTNNSPRAPRQSPTFPPLRPSLNLLYIRPDLYASLLLCIVNL